MMREDMTVGEVVVMRRTVMGMSQRRLAELTQVSTQTVSRIERGEKDWSPRASTVAVLEHALRWPEGTYERLQQEDPGAALEAITVGMNDDPPQEARSQASMESAQRSWSRSTYEASQRLSDSDLSVLAAIVDAYVDGHEET